jgi:hypothetical protein
LNTVRVVPRKGILALLGFAALLTVLAGLGVITFDVSRESGDTRRVGFLSIDLVRGPASPEELASDWGFKKDATAQQWDPPLAAGSGMELITLVDRHLGPCIGYRGAGYQGGACFQNGWAVQAEFTNAVDSTLVVGMTIPEATHVRFGRSDEALTIPVVDVPGRTTERYFAFVVPPDGLKVEPNDIVALDARGRLLGRQHYNDGQGGFGANDGRYERGELRGG